MEQLPMDLEAVSCLKNDLLRDSKLPLGEVFRQLVDCELLCRLSVEISHVHPGGLYGIRPQVGYLGTTNRNRAPLDRSSQSERFRQLTRFHRPDVPSVNIVLVAGEDRSAQLRNCHEILHLELTLGQLLHLAAANSHRI
jgi:hypothetical protein